MVCCAALFVKKSVMHFIHVIASKCPRTEVITGQAFLNLLGKWNYSAAIRLVGMLDPWQSLLFSRIVYLK
jgi:hypothetical protein